MKKLNLVLLAVDDWQCLYVNGKSFDQGHSIEFERFFISIIGQEIIIESFEHIYLELSEDNEHLINYGNRFPESLENVVEYQNLKK